MFKWRSKRRKKAESVKIVNIKMNQESPTVEKYDKVNRQKTDDGYKVSGKKSKQQDADLQSSRVAIKVKRVPEFVNIASQSAASPRILSNVSDPDLFKQPSDELYDDYNTEGPVDDDDGKYETNELPEGGTRGYKQESVSEDSDQLIEIMNTTNGSFDSISNHNMHQLSCHYDRQKTNISDAASMINTKQSNEKFIDYHEPTDYL